MGGRVVQLTYWFPFLHLANLILTFLEWYCCDRNQKDHRASPQMMGSLNGPFEQIIAHKWWWCQFGFCWCIKILALNFTCHRGSCWEVILGCCAVAFLLLYYSSSKALYTSNWIFWGKYSNDFPYPRYRTLSPFCRIFSNTMFSFQVCISLLQRCWFLLVF